MTPGSDAVGVLLHNPCCGCTT